MNLAAMMKRTSSCAALFVATAIFFSATSAQAGALNTPANLALSYNGSWAGSTAFSTGTLSGYVDWAVFKAADFPYTGAGYTPTAGELVYAYQVFVTGTAVLSHFDVDVPNDADNIGTFTSIGTVAPSAMSLGLAPTLAAFDFHAPAIPQFSDSIGLAYSSNKVPQSWFGSVIDTGQSTFVVPIPSPSNVNVPEPATAALLCLGAALLVPTAVRRLRKR
jgi:hypothetical protein